MRDNGPKMSKKFDNRYEERQSPGVDKSKRNMDEHTGSSRPEPSCPFWTCKAKGANHLIKKWPEATEEEKRSMLAAIAAEKARYGPSRSTRIQTSAVPTAGHDKTTGTAGLITDAVKIIDQASATSFDIIVSDGDATLATICRCDDGADDSFVAFQLAYTAFIKGIGKIKSIKPVWLQVARKNGDKLLNFSFSRT